MAQTLFVPARPEPASVRTVLQTAVRIVLRWGRWLAAGVVAGVLVGFVIGLGRPRDRHHPLPPPRRTMRRR